MKFSRLAVLVFVALPVALSAQADAVGDWEAVFVGPVGPRPKMFDRVTFSIQATSSGLTGMARAGHWPGDLTLSDVKLEGDRLTFTATGKTEWSTAYSGGPMVYHCCPKLVFAGTIEGNEITLTMTWQSTEQPDDPNAPQLPMVAARLPNKVLPLADR
jgi:hypothetical protein